MTEPVIIKRPDPARALPLLFDSPHSGNVFPDDMRAELSRHDLRSGEDAFIDELYEPAVDAGAVLLAATFPRTYIDANRSEADIEVGALGGEWPHPVVNSGKIARGSGLVWTKLRGEVPIYDRKLSVNEVENRIESYWRPYHSAVRAEYERLHAAFGRVYHINCHSMPRRGNKHTEDGPVERADFVLGDRDGSTAGPIFVELVRTFLAGRGYRVTVNDPMKGLELIEKYGRPADKRHSLQIEINRKLYMDEAAIEKNALYDETQATVRALIDHIAAFVRGSG